MNILFLFLIASLSLLAMLFVIFPFCKFTQAKITGLILSICIVITAPTLYYYTGASKKLIHSWALEKQTIQIQNKLKKIKNSQEIIDQLILHLQKKPESAQGWYLLGRLYLGNQNYQQAESVFKKAYQLQPKNENYSINLITASYFSHHQKLVTPMLKLLEQIVQNSPNNSDALNLLAIYSYQQGHYQQAIDYWQKLIQFFPSNSTDRQMLENMINKAQSQIKDKKSQDI